MCFDKCRYVYCEIIIDDTQPPFIYGAWGNILFELAQIPRRLATEFVALILGCARTLRRDEAYRRVCIVAEQRSPAVARVRSLQLLTPVVGGERIQGFPVRAFRHFVSASVFRNEALDICGHNEILHIKTSCLCACIAIIASMENYIRTEVVRTNVLRDKCPIEAMTANNASDAR